MRESDRAAFVQGFEMLRTARAVLVPFRDRVKVIERRGTIYTLRDVRGFDMINLPATEGVGAAFPSLPASI